MIDLRNSDLRRVHEIVGRFHSCRSYTELEHCTHLSVHELIGTDVTVWNEVSHTGRILSGSTWPVFDRKFYETFVPVVDAHLKEHPLVDQILKSWPRELAMQILPVHRFEETALYNEAFRHWSCRSQASFGFDTGWGSHHAVSINRRNGQFTACEMGMLQILATHLRMAWRTIRDDDQLNRSIDALRRNRDPHGSFWLLLGPALAVSGCSENARAVVARHFKAPRCHFHLPGTLQPRLEALIGEWRASSRPMNRRTDRFDLDTSGNGLHLEFTQEDDLNFRLEGFEDHNRHSLASASVESTTGVKELTCREREVLRWLSEGKTNPEIAVIVGIARRTVENHTQAIFEKLGIHNRAALIRHFD